MYGDLDPREPSMFFYGEFSMFDQKEPTRFFTCPFSLRWSNTLRLDSRLSVLFDELGVPYKESPTGNSLVLKRGSNGLDDAMVALQALYIDGIFGPVEVLWTNYELILSYMSCVEEVPLDNALVERINVDMAFKRTGALQMIDFVPGDLWGLSHWTPAQKEQFLSQWESDCEEEPDLAHFEHPIIRICKK